MNCFTKLILKIKLLFIKDIEMLPDKLKEVFWTEAESNYKIYKNSFMLKIMKEKQKETQK
ncbi:hypothetical protein HZA55_08215 [Candidatus Poribacteria bacterium]|nr:hypothetical protein [Candidatus Poribacteria bacterium]